MEQKFYICSHCGKIITSVKETGVPVICCGDIMKELIAGTTDAAQEKHVPVYAVESGKVVVKVGSVEHPLTNEHFIEWVCLQTNIGLKINHLKPNDKPETVFAVLENEEVEAVYAYCNLHSLWKSE